MTFAEVCSRSSKWGSSADILAYEPEGWTSRWIVRAGTSVSGCAHGQFSRHDGGTSRFGVGCCHAHNDRNRAQVASGDLHGVGHSRSVCRVAACSCADNQQSRHRTIYGAAGAADFLRERRVLGRFLCPRLCAGHSGSPQRCQAVDHSGFTRALDAAQRGCQVGSGSADFLVLHRAS